MLKTILTTVFAVLLSICFAQKKAEKWGKISEEDLKMTVYPLDSAASAIILQDVGRIGMEFNGRDFDVFFSHSRRIKVFDVAGFKEGNLAIPYRSRRNDQSLIDLDVQITLPNGEKQKVTTENIYTEKLSKNLWAKKVFIPNLQKGAVIEYRYKLRSNDFFALYDWYFQDEMPVRWSEVEVSIPEYYEYVYLMRTTKPFDLKTSAKEDVISGGSRFAHNILQFGMSDMPAIREEPYVTTTEDYKSHISFQLKSIGRPGYETEEILSSWEAVSKRLMEMDGFGVQITKKNKFNALWDAYSAILSTNDDAKTKAEKALQLVRENISWNGKFRITSTDNLDDAYEKKTGASADLNLAVVALLKKAGLLAWPVLTSTRSHGEMYPEYPFVDQFNSVLALVQIENDFILLDATNPFNDINQLSREHNTSAGWIVDVNKSEWFDFSPQEQTETWLGDVTISEDGILKGHFSMVGAGSSAVHWRSMLHNKKPEAFLKTTFAQSFPDTKTDSIEVANEKDIKKPLTLKFYCEVPGAVNEVNDFLYVRPILDFYVLENPFKSPKREFPVNFVYPVKSTYIFNLRIPEGYTLTDMPPGAKIALPDNAGKLLFSCSKPSDKMVQVILKMQLNKLNFEPDEYAALRQFFSLIGEKTQTQLVLKKS
jgi:hypothetical protein